MDGNYLSLTSSLVLLESEFSASSFRDSSCSSIFCGVAVVLAGYLSSLEVEVSSLTVSLLILLVSRSSLRSLFS